jgi:hypothetical protein
MPILGIQYRFFNQQMETTMNTQIKINDEIAYDVNWLVFSHIEPLCFLLILAAYLWAAKSHFTASNFEAARVDMFLGLSYLAYALFKVIYLLGPALW